MAAPRKTRIKVGVIGLGIIGTRVAANLRSAGHQVYVWSRTPRAAPNFLGSVVEVADLCDVIQLFVSDDGALEDVVRTITAALSPRHTVACHATVSPEATRRAASIIESQGARYLDAPFTGSKMAAQNRQLVYYVGGTKAALEVIRPVLEATSKAVLHVGGVGDASVIKIATNMLTASTVQTLAEALALVRAAGIDGSKFAEALENNGSRSGTSDLKLPAMLAGNFEPNFSLKHMFKDVKFAQELADEYELSLPVTDTTAEVFSLGMQNGWGEQDFGVVAQLYPAPAAASPPPAAPEAAASEQAVVPSPPEPAADAPPSPATNEPAPVAEITGPTPPLAIGETSSAIASSPSPVSGASSSRPTITVPLETEPVGADSGSESASDAKPVDAPAAPEKKKGLASEAVSAPDPDASPAKQEKKSTLRIIRDFFKPVSTQQH